MIDSSTFIQQTWIDSRTQWSFMEMTATLKMCSALPSLLVLALKNFVYAKTRHYKCWLSLIRYGSKRHKEMPIANDGNATQPELFNCSSVAHTMNIWYITENVMQSQCPSLSSFALLPSNTNSSRGKQGKWTARWPTCHPFSQTNYCNKHFGS